MSFNLAELFERVVAAVPDRRKRSSRRVAASLTGRSTTERIGWPIILSTTASVPVTTSVSTCSTAPSTSRRCWRRSSCGLFPSTSTTATWSARSSTSSSTRGLTALVFHRRFGARVAAVVPQVPSLRHLLVVDDDGGEAVIVDGVTGEAVDYEIALAATAPMSADPTRSGNDLYIAYTGGTTGLPKGVVWRHEDLFYAALGGGDPLLDKGPITDPDELADRIPDFPMTQLCAPPLMHVSAHWGAFNTLFGGGKVVLAGPGGFDADEIWTTVGTEGVNVLTVVGDAMARPLLDRFADAPGCYDRSSLIVLASGGAILSTSTKKQIGELLPGVIVIDAFGSSETGLAGSRSGGSDDASGAGAARFTVDKTTAVLDDNLRPVEPGSGIVGRLARHGHVPLGYLGDEEKTSRTFIKSEGTRWVLPGDMATVEADGTVVLLGRGSGSINTGGEKVFPEEVEVVLKGHPAVFDVLVVGVPDERWGERVAAVVQLRPGASLTFDEMREHGRSGLADYKIPRQIHVVDEVRRGANGKPDYGWAKNEARGLAEVAV